MEALLQLGNQVPEHMGRGGKPVQENERGELGLPRFPVEKFEAVDFDVVIGRHGIEFYLGVI
jgi:hypothetical protein